MRDEDNPREGPSRETLAYIAGIIDGEGTVIISKSKAGKQRISDSYTLNLRVGNTDRRMIDFLASVFPAQIHFRRMKSAKWKSCWMWTLTGPRVIEVLKAIRPYLVCKGTQADCAVEYLEGFKSSMRNGRNGVPDDETARREMFYQRMKALNRKGPPATTERENTSDGEATV